jgi:hypothetical protein
VTEEARPDRRAFYGVVTWSVPAFALLGAFSLLSLMGGSEAQVLAVWVVPLVIGAVLVVRYRWRAVAGLSVGLVVGFATGYLAVLVSFQRTFR